MKRINTKKVISALICLTMIAAVLMTASAPASAYAAGASTAYGSSGASGFVFSDTGITVTGVSGGYSIDKTTLTVKADGVYRVSGSCSDGSIVISKGLTGVTLILDGLSLASSSTAPVVIKKSCSVSIHLTGVSSLTDNEDPDDEAGSDTFEGAAIKVKSGSTVTFCGDGDLNITANVKNGIKGGSTSSLIFDQSGTVTVTGSGKYCGGTTAGAAVNSGIACDGSIVFNQGTYIIRSAGDGIKSSPDATNKADGTVIDKESAGSVTINGGNFEIRADGDGIEADTALSVNGGTFDIQTWKGYGTWNDSLANAHSCKGLKASGDRAEEAELEPAITVTGGTFTLDTGDDAIHSDAYVTVTGGAFTITTGDDGIHVGTTLTLGAEDGLCRDPDVMINNSYEGLEGGTVYIYSGRYYVVSSDDGVNAAGGSSNGSDPGGGGGHTFNPGGGHGQPGGPGGPGGSSSGDYNIYIYGGELYVNCSGDGLDSNGGLYLYGGRQAVFSMRAGGDNSALDADGTVLIQGATVFTAGTAGVDGKAQNSWFGSGQKYAASTKSYNAGKIIDTKAGGELIFSCSLVRNVNYIMASWPSSVSESAPSFSEASAVTVCKGGSWSHSWDEGAVNGNTVTYTCTLCGETETGTLAAAPQAEECGHFSEETYLTGDCNYDGEVNNKDAAVLFRYVSSELSSAFDPVFDFNKDGAVNNKDVTLLFRSVSSN